MSSSSPNLRLVDDQFDRWIEAVSFLNFFTRGDGESDAHVFQLLDDRPEIVVEVVDGEEKERKTPRPGRIKAVPGSLNDGGMSDFYVQLARLNREKDCGIYFTVNRTDLKGRKLKNILARRAIWNEHDAGDVPDFPLPPSLTVESSPGHFHFYWLVSDDLSSEAFAGLMQVQVDQFGSDPDAKDETRVLRVPGFYWRKGEYRDGKPYPKAEPFLVRLVGGDGRRYTAQELIEAFKPEVREPSKSDAEIKPPKASARPERVRSALKSFAPRDRDHWIGTIGAIRDEFGNSGYRIAEQWCADNAELIDTFDDPGLDYAWGYLERDRMKRRNIESIFYDARQNGWNEFGDIIVLDTDAEQEIIWPHRVEVKGKDPRADHPHFGNVVKLIEHTDRRLRYNTFAARIEINKGSGFVPLDDITVKQLRSYAGTKGLRTEKQLFIDHLAVLANKNQCHPVREYLTGLKWDGKPRLDRWAITYLGAEDTPLHRAFGRVMLLGAVHRVMRPGCQFDYMVVLEGPQGKLKSSALRALGEPWFTDSLRLGSDCKVTIEQTAGYWFAEVAELAGMGTREIDAVKTQITTREDRARAAYGYFASTIPRQFIMVGTTNESEYLKDRTGNRRFLPIRVGEIDLDALRRDRDQLFAEAFHGANGGELPILPEDVLAAAAEAQAARVVADAVTERLREIMADVPGGRIEKEDIWKALNLADVSKRTLPLARSITATMKELGWAPTQQWRQAEAGKPRRRRECYEKVVSGRPLEWLDYWDGEFLTKAEKDAKGIFG